MPAYRPGAEGAIDIVTRDWMNEYAVLTVQIPALDETGDITVRTAARRAAMIAARGQVGAKIRLAGQQGRRACTR